MKNEMGLLIARRMSGKNKQGRPFQYTWSEGERNVPRHCVGAKERAVALPNFRANFLKMRLIRSLSIATSLGSWKHFSCPQEENEVSVICGSECPI